MGTDCSQRGFRKRCKNDKTLVEKLQQTYTGEDYNNITLGNMKQNGREETIE